MLVLVGGIAYKAVDVTKYLTCLEWKRGGLLTTTQQNSICPVSSHTHICFIPLHSSSFADWMHQYYVINMYILVSQQLTNLPKHSMLVKSVCVWVDGMPMNGHEFTLGRCSLQGRGFQNGCVFRLGNLCLCLKCDLCLILISQPHMP